MRASVNWPTLPLSFLHILGVARGLKPREGEEEWRENQRETEGWGTVTTFFYLKIPCRSMRSVQCLILYIIYSCEGTQVVLDSRLIAMDHPHNSYMVLTHTGNLCSLEPLRRGSYPVTSLLTLSTQSCPCLRSHSTLPHILLQSFALDPC